MNNLKKFKDSNLKKKQVCTNIVNFAKTELVNLYNDNETLSNDKYNEVNKNSYKTPLKSEILTPSSIIPYTPVKKSGANSLSLSVNMRKNQKRKSQNHSQSHSYSYSQYTPKTPRRGTMVAP